MMEGKRVLVVDDDPQVGVVMTKLLSEKGATVESVDSYDAGLAAIKDKKPDVAVVDVMLPEHSGLDLVKEIHSGPPPHPFFVVLTNSINAQHLADAMEASVTLFVQKADHDPREIAEMIARHFENAAG